MGSAGGLAEQVKSCAGTEGKAPCAGAPYERCIDRNERVHVGRINAFEAGLIAFGASLNVSIGYLVSALKLPLYLDSIGTILIAVLCGWKYGVVVGLAALFVFTLTAVPTVAAYAGTAVVVALTAAGLVRIGFLKNLRATIWGGLVIGLVATAASFPVTTFLYEGVSLAGSDAITTFFKASGMPVWKSVLWGSLITDPLDKLITSLICYTLIRAFPPRLLDRLPGHGGPFRLSEKH